MFLLPGGSEQALIDLINDANPTFPTPLLPTDLYFGKIQTVGSDGTVSIPAVTMYSSQFEGYARFEYKRLDIGKVYSGIKPKVKRVGYPTLYRLLPIINETLGTSFTEDDVVDISITWLSANEQINIPIIAKPDSRAYEGQFLVEYTRVRPELAAIAVQDLTALQHPTDPALGKMSLGMALWSLDFTDEAEKSLLSIGLGTWTYLTQFRAAMAARGFPDWPRPPYWTLQTGETKNFPRANKDFQFVILQRDVELADYQGDAYIHYNR